MGKKMTICPICKKMAHVYGGDVSGLETNTSG